MTKMQELKQPIRAFMLAHYTDERLAMLLAHARDGKLRYASCCCFIGAANAPHALVSRMPLGEESDHFMYALKFSGGNEAHSAYAALGMSDAPTLGSDDYRRSIIIPMIRAEMKRREKLRTPAEQTPELVAKEQRMGEM